MTDLSQHSPIEGAAAAQCVANSSSHKLGTQKFQHLSRVPASKGNHRSGRKSSLDELLWDIIRRFAGRIPSQKELPKEGRGSHIDLQNRVPQYLPAGFLQGVFETSRQSDTSRNGYAATPTSLMVSQEAEAILEETAQLKDTAHFLQTKYCGPNARCWIPCPRMAW